MAANASSYHSPPDDPLCFWASVVLTTAQSLQILLILPLSLLVLCLGFKRWRQPVPISHCDFFTYNLAILELIGISGNIFCLSFALTRLPICLQIGNILMRFPWSGQMVFPILSCVDRYLAVVHPITYMALKHGAGLRITLISAAIIWLLSFLSVGYVLFSSPYPQYIFILSACQMLVFLIVMTFCCVSVLCALIGPRPGEVPRDRQRADRSKRKAFIIILTIMVVLCIRFGGNLFPNVATTLQPGNCRAFMIHTTILWFNLPSSLVLPVLYLHRPHLQSHASAP